MFVGRKNLQVYFTRNERLRKEKENLIQIEGPHKSSSLLFLKPTYLTFLLNEKIFI